MSETAKSAIHLWLEITKEHKWDSGKVDVKRSLCAKRSVALAFEHISGRAKVLLERPLVTVVSEISVTILSTC